MCVYVFVPVLMCLFACMSYEGVCGMWKNKNGMEGETGYIYGIKGWIG